MQHFAGLFEQLAVDQGGGANGYDAQRIADAWFKRDVSRGVDQAAPFYRAVCREMRAQYDTDAGPSHNNHSAGSMPYLTAFFLYESCKFQNGFELVRVANPSNSTVKHSVLSALLRITVFESVCHVGRRRLVRA